MNSIPAEIIVRTNHILNFFSFVLGIQLKAKTISTFEILSRFSCLLDADAFHIYVLNYSHPMGPLLTNQLNKIYVQAKFNLDDYEKLLILKSSSNKENNEFYYIEDNPWKVEQKASIKELSLIKTGELSQKRFDNADFCLFSFRILEYLQVLFSIAEGNQLDNDIKSLISLPTAAQVSLFFYYLETAGIESLSRPDWPRLLTKYKFSSSPNSAYNAYQQVGKGDSKMGKQKDPMTMKNLAVVAGLLSQYPTAQDRCKNDFYDIERDVK